MKINVSPFGEISGRPVNLYTLTNVNGVIVKIMSYGACITEIHTPDRKGNCVDITTGFSSLAQYLTTPCYFGCTVGRYANRIAKGKFSLNGKTYTLAANNGPNNLHGGIKGFDKVVWDAEIIEGASDPTVQFTYLSVDMEEGFPGNVKASVTFSLSDKNELSMAYSATTDQPTPVNLTNHAYFNLKGAGNGNILDHSLMINADAYTPVSKDLIPTGEIRPVSGTPMDFKTPATIGSRIDLVDGGYDHNFVLSGKGLKLAARLSENTTGRVLEVYTTQPGVQFYSGNFLNGSIKGIGGEYSKHGAMCLETQHYPDSVNQPSFPSVILKPGETYKHTAKYVFLVA